MTLLGSLGLYPHLLFFPESIAKVSSGKIASLVTVNSPALSHSQTCTANLHEPTYTSQLAQPACTSQLARANLHEPTCTSQLTRANLHEPTCTSQLALANLHEPTCTSQLTRANLHENNLHEISHSKTCTRHVDENDTLCRDGVDDAQMLRAFYDPAVRARPSAEIGVVTEDFLRFLRFARDSLRGLAWSMSKN